MKEKNSVLFPLSTVKPEGLLTVSEQFHKVVLCSFSYNSKCPSESLIIIYKYFPISARKSITEMYSYLTLKPSWEQSEVIIQYFIYLFHWRENVTFTMSYWSSLITFCYRISQNNIQIFWRKKKEDSHHCILP